MGVEFPLAKWNLDALRKKNDPDTQAIIYNDYVTPFKVFDNVMLIDGSLGPPNSYARIHAETVASVMISTDPRDPDGAGPRTPPTGVAPGAQLLSIAAEVLGSFDAEKIGTVLRRKLAIYCDLRKNQF